MARRSSKQFQIPFCRVVNAVNGSSLSGFAQHCVSPLGRNFEMRRKIFGSNCLASVIFRNLLDLCSCFDVFVISSIKTLRKCLVKNC